MNRPFKIVVQGLPTNLQNQDFLKTIENYKESILYTYFVPGKIKFFFF